MGSLLSGQPGPQGADPAPTPSASSRQRAVNGAPAAAGPAPAADVGNHARRTLSAAIQPAPPATPPSRLARPTWTPDWLPRDTAPVEILEDAGDETSSQTGRRPCPRCSFAQAGQMLTARRLAARRLPPGFAVPVPPSRRRRSSREAASRTAGCCQCLLPYLLIISAFSGTIYAAFDQVAGEKERGTLETLLVSPASRRDIVLGKFGVIVAVCLISSVLTIAGLGLAFGSGLPAFGWLAQGGVRLGGVAVGVIGLALLPMSALFGGLLLAVSTYARNQKEAQTLLGPLFTLIMVPAVMSMTMTSDIARSLALVPVLNAALIIKQALTGSFDPGFIALAFLASLIYACRRPALCDTLIPERGRTDQGVSASRPSPQCWGGIGERTQPTALALLLLRQHWGPGAN